MVIEGWLSEVWMWKIVFGVIFGIECGIWGIVIPLWGIGKLGGGGRSTKERWISILNLFAGGLFLSGGFIHLLGESIGKMEEELPDLDFPLALFCAGSGFLGTFVLEKLIFKGGHYHHHHLGDVTNEIPAINSLDYELNVSKQQGGNGNGNATASTTITTDINESARTISADTILVESVSFKPSKQADDVSGYTLLFTMVIHSTISGFALGVVDDLGGVFGVGIAIAAHKWLESFAIAVGLNRMKTLPKFGFKSILSFMSVYVLSGPFGVLLGLCFSNFLAEESHWMRVMDGVIMACGSGMFIYVAAIDILLMEFEQMEYSEARALPKVLALLISLLGFVLMALVPLILPEHTHSSGRQQPSSHHH